MELYEYEKKHLAALRSHLAECTVLLKHNGDFPLKEPCKIAAYGSGVRGTIKGGTGSGEVNSRYFVSVEQGLENAGFTVTTKNWMAGYEAMYMCAGKTTHIVNGTEITLGQGELLFMNQRATHEVCKAREGDVAVNFIVLPEFFNSVLLSIGEEETPLRAFLVDCLCGQSTGAGYLHFRVADIVPIQNLIENLLFVLLQETHNKRKVSQMTMALLFQQLMGHTETLATPNPEEATMVRVLAYVESNYAHGRLTELAQQLHYDLYSLSREIKRKTGKNYTQLVQQRRLAQAAFLLKNTDRNIYDIANAVGYENMGYFHRIFRETYGLSPRSYRLQIR